MHHEQQPQGTMPPGSAELTYATLMQREDPAIQDHLMPHLQRLAAGETDGSRTEISPAHHAGHVELAAAAVPASESWSPAEVDELGADMELGAEAMALDVAPPVGLKQRLFGRFSRSKNNSGPQSLETTYDASPPSPAAEAATEVNPEPQAPASPYDRLSAMYERVNPYLEGNENVTVADRVAIISETVAGLAAEAPPMGNSERSVLAGNMQGLAESVRQQVLENPASNPEELEDTNKILWGFMQCQKNLDTLRFTVGSRENMAYGGVSPESIENIMQGEPDEYTEAGMGRNYVVEVLANKEGVLGAPETATAFSALAQASHAQGSRNVPMEFLAAAGNASGNPLYEVGAPIYGENMLRWGERTDLSPAIREMTEKPGYNARALENMKTSRIGEDPDDRAVRIEAVETLVLETELGLSPNLSDKLRVSLANRQDSGANKMALLLERCTNGERTEHLFTELGIVNFDRYDEDDLDRMYKLSQGDPVVIAEFRDTYSTLSITDALSDPTRAHDRISEELSPVSGKKSTIFGEASGPEDIDKLRLKLKSLGIQPSQLYIKAHGQPGSFKFGLDNITHADLEPSGLLDLIEDGMRPDINGEKHVIFDSCSLATRPDDYYITSLVEAVAEKTGATTWGSKIVTRSGARQIKGGHMRRAFTNPVEKFARNPDGTVTHTTHRYIENNPNVPKHVEEELAQAA